MEIDHKINKAASVVKRFAGPKRERLRHLGTQIQAAQDRLNAAAGSYFDYCVSHCRGLCCRNIQINDIITWIDLVYILLMDDIDAQRMRSCSSAETLFTADCLFLADGVGPCIFAPNCKPERCIITFCGDTQPIQKHIRSVRTQFSRLSRYILFQKPLAWLQF